jgi:hypothetical protein
MSKGILPSRFSVVAGGLPDWKVFYTEFVKRGTNV